MCIHTYTHTHTHTYIHTYIHTHTYVHTYMKHFGDEEEITPLQQRRKKNVPWKIYTRHRERERRQREREHGVLVQYQGEINFGFPSTSSFAYWVSFRTPYSP